MLRRLIILLALVVWCAPGSWATNYFVDSVTGDNGDTGLSEALAWATMDGKIEACTDGDTIFVRSRHEETLGSDIDVTGDGTEDAPVVIWGDDAGTGANRYWVHDSGDSTATITCGGYQLYFDIDENWHVHRIVWTGITEYGIGANRSGLVAVSNCSFTAMTASDDCGIRQSSGGNLLVENCVFNGGGQGIGINCSVGKVVVVNSTFDNLTSGILGTYGQINIVNCEFGQTTNNVTADCQIPPISASQIRIFGGLLDNNSGLVDANSSHYATNSVYISRFYTDAYKRPMLFVNAQNYEALADYAVHRDGGAPYSIALTTPIADNPGVYKTANMTSYAVYADSAETRTYSLYAWRDVNWDPAPTTAGLFIEVQYQYADTIRSQVSTATLVDDSTWYALSVADITPQHDGPVQITLWLGDYDADGKIHIDPRLVATGEQYHETFDWGAPALAYYYQAPAAGGGRRGQVIIIN